MWWPNKCSSTRPDSSAPTIAAKGKAQVIDLRLTVVRIPYGRAKPLGA